MCVEIVEESTVSGNQHETRSSAYEIDARASLAERLLDALRAEAAVCAGLADAGRFRLAELQQVPLVHELRLAHPHLQQVQLRAHVMNDK